MGNTPWIIKCQNGCKTHNTYNIQEIATGIVKAICMECVKKISLPKKDGQMFADLKPEYLDWDEK
jgi:hypothetical protein